MIVLCDGFGADWNGLAYNVGLRKGHCEKILEKELSIEKACNVIFDNFCLHLGSM